MRGRKPKPTAIRLLEGSRITRREPNAPRGKLVPPDHLSDIAKQAWQQAVKILNDIGVLSTADAFALELFCESYAAYREAGEEVKKFGKVLKSPKGYLYQSPFVGMKNTAHEQCLKLLNEFGMTPVSRSRLAVVGGPLSNNDDDFARFLRGA